MINSLDLVISYFYALLSIIMIVKIICSNFSGFVSTQGVLNHYVSVLVFTFHFSNEKCSTCYISQHELFHE